MTLDEVYNVLYYLVDDSINKKINIGVCGFTSGSAIVTGANFITNSVVTVGGYVKLESDDSYYFEEIQSIDSETQLTLKNAYNGATDSNESVYSETKIPVIFSSNNAPRPAQPYFVIHDPPVSNTVITPEQENQNTDNDGLLIFYSRWEAFITFEEVGGSGDLIINVLNWARTSKMINHLESNLVTLMRSETINAFLENDNEFIIKRAQCDVIFHYIRETVYETGIIESATITGQIDDKTIITEV